MSSLQPLFLGTQTTGAEINGLARTVNHSLHLADVGLPGSVAFTVRMGNGITEHNTLAAHCTFCHLRHLLINPLLQTENIYINQRKVL